MILRIARKEVKEALRDGRFRWGGIAVFGLLLVTLGMSWGHRRDIARAHAAAEARTWEHFREQGEKNPHSAAHYGVYAFRPVTALSLIDQGVNPYVGVAVWLEAHQQNPFEYRPAQDATSAARFGVLSPAGVLQLLVPLFVILFAFSAVSSERENGTLRQVLSLGVSGRALLWGKVLGAAAALALLLLPALLVGAVALVLGASEAGLPGAARSLLLAATYVAYLAVILSVTIATSASARSSRTALVALLAFWIANALVAPRAAADLAEAIYPLPSRAALDAAIQHDFDYGLDGRSPATERNWAVEDSLLAVYGVSTRAELPVELAGVLLQASEEYGNLVFDKHYGDLARTLERQESVHRWAGFLAPLIAVRNLSMAFAGTDAAHHAHFVNAAEQHRRLIQRILNEDIAKNAVGLGEKYVAGPELWARVPRFEYRPPGVGEALATQRWSIGALLFWVVGAAWLLHLAARRLRAV